MCMAKEVTIAREGKVSVLNVEGLPSRYVPSSNYIRAMQQKWSGRLTIHPYSDGSEIEDNVRAAEAMLSSFPDMTITIREHKIIYKYKNPEYEINGVVGDRKGIWSDKGVSNAFSGSIEQGCKAVVLDLDMHMQNKTLKVDKFSGRIYNRRKDFKDGLIKECYVVHHGKAVRINASHIVYDNKEASKVKIGAELEKLKQR